MTTAIRVEMDLLGARDVPAGAYWGVHTLRALENFPITGTANGNCAELVVALASVLENTMLPRARLEQIFSPRALTGSA